ncbi:hypothetical protein ACFQH6_18720 [Halobacteriaceae archaeon GCM10025711]
MRVKLAIYADDPLFPSERAEQFVKDIDEINDVKGVDDGPNSLVDQIAEANDASTLRGNAFEARVAADQDVTAIDEIGRVPKYADGRPITDIDVHMKNGDIIEAKNSMRGKGDDLADKLKRFETAHTKGEIDINGRKITFTSSDGVTAADKAKVKGAIDEIIDNPNNGIEELDVEYEIIDPVEK